MRPRLLVLDLRLLSVWMRTGLITAQDRSVSGHRQPKPGPFITSVNRLSTGAAVADLRDPVERGRMATTSFSVGWFLAKLLPIHRSTMVLLCKVPGLTTTGIDRAFLSSFESVWEAGQYLQALIPLRRPLCLNWCAHVITEYKGEHFTDS